MQKFRAGVLIASLGMMAGCAPWQPTPVDERRPVTARPAPPTQTRTAPPIYEVRRGDTLYSLSFRFGLDWRDVAEWNRIQAPFTIRPGQELRMSPPPSAAARPVASTPTPAPTPAPGTSPPSTSSAPAERQTVPENTSRAPSPSSSSSSNLATRSAGGVTWRWPTQGDVVRKFDPAATRRGIGVRGQAGQDVLAAADGEVVYSGTALIGYGELIIIKHSETMLSAYGHNRRRLVEEGARVRGGQAIAEMGMNERDEQILHFEIRRNGQAEDPLGYLPPR